MRTPTASLAGFQRVFAVLAVLVLAAAVLLGVQREDSPPAPAAALAAPEALVGKAEPAKNPTTLSLIVDGRKVLGWISGTQDYTGREVTVESDGKTQSVMVQESNFFTWHYQVDKPMQATFTIEGMRQIASLEPVTALQPTAFFVVDRSVYRPGQDLKFAGFLRKVNEQGELVPMAGQAVGVAITSERKKTTAARLELVSDEMGRIEGVYRWTDGDVIDDYTVSIDGYKGAAKVALAEYRKSKIKLKIAGKVEGEQLTLTFDAVDFLEKPVPGSKVSFTMQVVENAKKQDTWSLKGEDFAYFTRRWIPLPAREDLSEEEALLVESDSAYLPMGGQGAKTVIWQESSEIALENGSATHTMKLNKQWIGARHALDVQGVLIDVNGREQRASHTVRLDDQSRKGLNLTMARRYFAVDETIRVKARPVDDKGEAIRGSSTLVAMKLTPAQVLYYPPSELYGYDILGNGASYRNGRWRTPPQLSEVQRRLVTAAAFQGDTAEFKLSEPGAYKLVVVTQVPGGTSMTEEIGCVVRDPEDTPGLVLTTGKGEYAAGEMLEGEIHSRFTDARVLLTLRDSGGVRLWKAMTLKGQVEKFRLRLPEEARYGADLAVQYVEGNGKVHVADQLVRIRPEHRFISVKTELKDQVAPGETVKLKFSVNRKEPVDLVVSVYDQSLLGITGDKQIDIRNFYFADERGLLERDRDVLRRRAGHLTVGAAVEQAEAVIKAMEKSADPRDVAQRATLTRAANNAKNGYIDVHAMVALLQVSGVNARLFLNPYYGGGWEARYTAAKSGQTRLIDLIETRPPNQWYLVYRYFNDTLVLTSTHPSYENNPQYHTRAYYGGAYPWRGRYYDYEFDQRGLSIDRSVFSPRGESALTLSGISGNGAYSVQGQAFLSHGIQSKESMESPMDMGGGPNSGGSPDGTIRRDFSDAAFWNAHVRTDANGDATVEFKLPDSLTNWQVVVTAVTKDLHVGNGKASFRTFKPIMVWPMLPRNFTQGDKVAIFATVHNQTDKPQTIKTTIKIDNGEILSSPETVNVDVPAKSNVPVYWTYRAAKTGYAQILMSAESAAGNDASLKRLPVVDASVWETKSFSGFCKEQAAFTVPAGVDLNLAGLEVSIAPSLAADMAETLDYLVDYPHGCVEQTMSRFLPAIKVAQILKKFEIKNPALEEKLPKCVDMGIKRLLELQQPDGGWGWNGNSQTHEMMTPYALYGLLEVEKAGYKIPNEQAIQRGLARLRQFIDAMGEAQRADRIYCMYIYANREKLQPEWWTFIDQQSQKGNLSDYATAMALEMAANASKGALANDLAAQLRKRATRASGTASWTTAGFSRWGDDRNEITAAALKALVAYDAKDALVPEILTYFAQGKRGNRWNSTKDTAMILYAMCDYLARQDYDLRGAKVATLRLNDNAATQAVKIENGLTQKVAFAGVQLNAGRNALRFENASAGMMYRINLRYRQGGTDINPAANGITVTRDFFLLGPKGETVRQLKKGDTIARGSYIMSCVVANTNIGGDLRYVLVENPKPGSCEIQPVEDLRFQQSATAYVLREDKEVGVYWHHEQTGGSIQDICVLRAEMSGEFVVAPASVEMMYRPETRGHSGTFNLTVSDEAKVAAK